MFQDSVKFVDTLGDRKINFTLLVQITEKETNTSNEFYVLEKNKHVVFHATKSKLGLETI